MRARDLAAASGPITLLAPRRRIEPRPPGLARAGRGGGGYGPLVAAGPELLLPEGFQYRVFGRTGEIMSDGYPTPGAHDGMACYADPGGHVRLVRNHEVRSRSGAFGNPS